MIAERLTEPDELMSVRHIVDDVERALDDPCGNAIELFQPAGR